MIMSSKSVAFFISLIEYETLEEKGKIYKKQKDEKVTQGFKKFNGIQINVSEFDSLVAKVTEEYSYTQDS